MSFQDNSFNSRKPNPRFPNRNGAPFNSPNPQDFRMNSQHRSPRFEPYRQTRPQNTSFNEPRFSPNTPNRYSQNNSFQNSTPNSSFYEGKRYTPNPTYGSPSFNNDSFNSNKRYSSNSFNNSSPNNSYHSPRNNYKSHGGFKNNHHNNKPFYANDYITASMLKNPWEELEKKTKAVEEVNNDTPEISLEKVVA